MALGDGSLRYLLHYRDVETSTPPSSDRPGYELVFDYGQGEDLRVSSIVVDPYGRLLEVNP